MLIKHRDLYVFYLTDILMNREIEKPSKKLILGDFWLFTDIYRDLRAVFIESPPY